MWNYYQLITEAEERQRLFLARAEQRRLLDNVPGQPHPLRLWIGKQLIQYGQRLQTAKSQSVSFHIPAVLSR